MSEKNLQNQIPIHSKKQTLSKLQMENLPNMIQNIYKNSTAVKLNGEKPEVSHKGTMIYVPFHTFEHHTESPS